MTRLHNGLTVELVRMQIIPSKVAFPNCKHILHYFCPCPVDVGEMYDDLPTRNNVSDLAVRRLLTVAVARAVCGSLLSSVTFCFPSRWDMYFDYGQGLGNWERTST
jgi:hypothetical protein